MGINDGDLAPQQVKSDLLTGPLAERFGGGDRVLQIVIGGKYLLLTIDEAFLAQDVPSA
jgi:hypothetical protein